MLKYAAALAVALVLNAAANLMIKLGMRAIDLDLGGAGLLDGGLWGLGRLLLRHWIVLAGLVCFATNVVFYAYALQKLPVSAAYPIMVACGFAIIVVVAGFMLRERLSALQWIGVAAILAGVVLVARDAGRQMGGPAPSGEPDAPGAGR
ncbi:MAG: EamA family transporter [Deltaproteobacteria bacterium]|nr:EamA family transporter [Deltaproteobacteria bacterium]